MKVEDMQGPGAQLREFSLPGEDSRELVTELIEPAHPGARLLYDHWRSCLEQGGLVIGRDVPSRNVATILRNLLVYEPVNDQRDFYIRLSGDSVARRFGRDITGTLFSQYFTQEVFIRRSANMREMMRTGEPFLRDVKLLRNNRPEMHFEVVNVSALAPDAKTPWILGGIFYFD